MKGDHNDNSIEARFQRHLESYDDFKQTLALQRKDDMQLFKDLKETMETLTKMVQPISEVFEGSKFTGKLIANSMKLLVLVGSVVGAIALIGAYLNKHQ